MAHGHNGYTSSSMNPAPVPTSGTISARLDRLPATRSIWRLITLLSFGLFFELYDLLFTAYVGPSLVRQGILTATTPGLFGTTGLAGFVAAMFSGLFVATLAGAFLSDRFGRRAIFNYSLLWTSFANVVMALQNTALGLNVWRFLAGLGVGLELITIGTYLTELAPKSVRGRAFAFCQTIGFTAVPIAAGLAYLLAPHRPFGIEGWRLVVMVGSAGSLLVWWTRRRLPESPRWLAEQGRLGEADRVVTDLEQRALRESGPLPPVGIGTAAVEKAGFRDMWAPPYGKRAVMLIIWNVFQTVAYYGFASWVPTLLVAQGITVTSSLFYTAIIAIAAPFGPLLGLGIGDRFERKDVIVAMACVNIAAGLLFSQARSAPAIIAVGVCLTLSANIISYSFHAYQQEVFPTAIRSRAAGFVYSWSRLSAIFNAFVVAFALRHWGVGGVFAMLCSAMAVAALAIAALGPRTRGVAIEQI